MTLDIEYSGGGIYIYEIILEEIKSLDDPYYKDYVDRNQVMEIIRSHMNEEQTTVKSLNNYLVEAGHE